MKGMSSPYSRQISPWRDPSSSSSAQPRPRASSISSLPSQANSTASPLQAPWMEPVRLESELAAVLAEQDIGARHGHVVAGCLDDPPSAPDAHIGSAKSLGRRISGLSAASASVKAASTQTRPCSLTLANLADALIQPNTSSIRLRQRWLTE